MNDLRERIIEQIKQKRQEACIRYGIEVFQVTVEFDTTGKTAGWAQTRYVDGKPVYIIKFNMGLAARNEEDFISQVVVHELAHIIDRVLHGESSHHGHNWQRIMIDFGLVPARCHNYDVSEVSKDRRPYMYQCACGHQVSVGKQVHQKIQSGKTYWHCKGRSLKFVGTKNTAEDILEALR